MAKFTEVISCLRNGGMATRRAWTEDKEIMLQIPQRISKDIVPKMTSVQDMTKYRISNVGSGELEYHDQVIAITFEQDDDKPSRATYYNPTWEDIFANDWMLTQAPNSYKARMVDEYAELKDRTEKLGKFFDTEIFKVKLSESSQNLMKDQYQAMTQYLNFLGQRCKLEGAFPLSD